jgi:hypothetical protein
MGLIGLMVWGLRGGGWEFCEAKRGGGEVAERGGEGKWRGDVVDLIFGGGWQDASATGAVTNDADRLKKYLARFGVTFEGGGGGFLG